MEEMIILGIDPGFGRMGFGIVTVQKGRCVPKDFGAITTPTGLEHGERLLAIAEDLETLFDEYKPTLLALEKLFFGKSSTTAMRVAEARGVVLMMAAKKGVEVIEYAPSQIKKALTGDGKADKGAMQRMVKELLNLPRTPKPDDAADALAVAMCASTKRW